MPTVRRSPSTTSTSAKATTDKPPLLKQTFKPRVANGTACGHILDGMASDDEKQRAARDAYKKFVTEPSVFLIYGDNNLGSGIVFQSKKGEPTIYARHVAEDLSSGVD